MRRLALAAFVGLASSAHAADPHAVIGTWWTPEKDGAVQITTCPAGLCGNVIGIGTFKPDGSPPLDLHGHTRCHLQIITDGRVDSDGVWDGHIVNPDNDKKYTITLQVTDDGRLRMRGYLLVPLLGQTVFWNRFDKHVTPDCHVRD